jgi:hypothetical protein
VCGGAFSGGLEIAAAIYNVFVWSELSEVSPELQIEQTVDFFRIKPVDQLSNAAIQMAP